MQGFPLVVDDYTKTKWQVSVNSAANLQAHELFVCHLFQTSFVKNWLRESQLFLYLV
jgi:hypothetical protein